MLLIPIRADETVYHRAWGTFAIIATNIALFLVFDPAKHVDVLVLEFGALKPWQWITAAFTHVGVMHLGLNMLFLFWFGQIVEGRVGTPRFIALYLGMAAAEGCLTQILMFGADEGGAVGASGVIYGLMVIALFFSPGTRLTMGLWIIVILWRFEIRARTLAIIYLVISLVGAALLGFRMSSSALHLIGALAGLGAAFAIRQADWWYEPPEDEEAGDVREPPVLNRTAPDPEPVKRPAPREELPPLELD